MILCLFFCNYIYRHRDQKFLAGLRRGAFRLISIPPGLHRVESVAVDEGCCAKGVHRHWSGQLGNDGGQSTLEDGRVT